jgi:hypothetical protein
MLSYLCAVPLDVFFQSAIYYLFQKTPLHLFSSHFLPDEMPRNNIIRPYFVNDSFLIIFVFVWDNIVF